MDRRTLILMHHFMKKIILLLFFGLFSLSVLAQRPGRPDREQLEAARIAFITTRLDLSPDQAQKFWPIFNEFNNERNSKLREIAGLSNEESDLSDQDAKNLIKKRFDIQKSMIEDEILFVEKASSVLSYNQILKLNQINKDFTRQMFQRQRRGNN